jgi:hypothetical protein
MTSSPDIASAKPQAPSLWSPYPTSVSERHKTLTARSPKTPSHLEPSHSLQQQHGLSRANGGAARKRDWSHRDCKQEQQPRYRRRVATVRRLSKFDFARAFTDGEDERAVSFLSGMHSQLSKELTRWQIPAEPRLPPKCSFGS